MATSVKHDDNKFVTRKELQQAVEEAVNIIMSKRLDRIEQKIDELLGHQVKSNGHA